MNPFWFIRILNHCFSFWLSQKDENQKDENQKDERTKNNNSRNTLDGQLWPFITHSFQLLFRISFLHMTHMYTFYPPPFL